MARQYRGNLPIFNFRGGEVSGDWENDSVREASFPKLFNLITDGAAVSSRPSTLYKWTQEEFVNRDTFIDRLLPFGVAITAAKTGIPTDTSDTAENTANTTMLNHADQIVLAINMVPQTEDLFPVIQQITSRSVHIRDRVNAVNAPPAKSYASQATALYNAVLAAIDGVKAYQAEIRDLNDEGGKNSIQKSMRLMGFKFIVFPEDLNFPEFDEVLVVVVRNLANQDQPLRLYFRSYDEEGDSSEWRIRNTEGTNSFDFEMDELDLNSDLSKWEFKQRYGDLFILTDKGGLYKITPKLTKIENTNNRRYAGCTLSVEIGKIEGKASISVNAVDRGPKVGAVYYSAQQSNFGTNFQKLPFFINHGLVNDPNRKSFLYREQWSRDPNYDVGFKNGVWWSGTDLQANGATGEITSSVRFINECYNIAYEDNALTERQNSVEYACSYVDQEGNESPLGDRFVIWDEGTSYQQKSQDKIQESNSYYGTAAMAGQSFAGSLVRSVQQDNNDRCENSCFDPRPSDALDACGSTNFTNSGNEQNLGRCFSVISNYASELTGKTNPNARFKPNRMMDYDGVFNIGGINNAFQTGRGTTTGRLYPKRFNGGHHRILPGQSFKYKNYFSSDIEHTMQWHLLLDPTSLKPGQKCINIYKKEYPPEANHQNFNFYLFKILFIPEAERNVQFDPANLTVNSEGTTEKDGVRLTYSFRDNGETVDQTISSSTEIYNIGDDNPKAMTFYQQRLFLGNFKGFPSLLRGSDLGKITFGQRKPIQPDDSIEVRPETGQGEVIRHMVSRNDLILLTDRSTHRIRGRDGIGPGNVNIGKQDPYGASALFPLEVEESVLFFEKGYQKLRDYLYSFKISNYQGNDLIFYSRHLFRNKQILDWTYQEGNPGKIWAVRSDGDILCMTYLKELEMIGWSRHQLSGGFKARQVKSIFLERPNIVQHVLYVLTEGGHVLLLDTLDADDQRIAVDFYGFATPPVWILENQTAGYTGLNPFITNDNYKKLYGEINQKEAVFQPVLATDGNISFHILNRDNFREISNLDNEPVTLGFKMDCEIRTFPILTGLHLSGPRVLPGEPDLSVLTNPSSVTMSFRNSMPVYVGTVDHGIGNRDDLSLVKFPPQSLGIPGEVNPQKFSGRRPALTGSNWSEENPLVIKNIEGMPMKITGISVDFE